VSGRWDTYLDGVESSLMGSAGSYIHKTAYLEPGVTLGGNVEIGPNVVIYSGTSLADGVRVGANSVLGQRPTKAKSSTLKLSADLPGLSVGAGTTVGVGAVLYAGTTVGRDCFIADGAQIRERCAVGESVIIGRAATVENDCEIGARTRIQTGAYITADSVLEEDVFIAPMVITTNDNFIGRTERRFELRKGVTVRRAGRIAAGAVILPGIEIGQEAVVAAGSVVTHDVPPYKVVMGVPARVIRDVPEDQLVIKKDKF
jgi:acetyltransferase-like isoleucine patch superfamily enzyme